MAHEPASGVATLAPTSAWVVANGVRLHYADWGGAPFKRTFMLLHGGAANHHWWDSVAPLLTDHGRVVALDFRGHGLSQWARPPHYGPQAYVDDLRVVIEQLGTRVILAGHSMGGAVTQWAAVLTPQLLEGAVIMDSIYGRPPLWKRLQWRWRRRAQGGKRPALNSADAVVARFRLVPPDTYLSRQEIARLALACAEQLPDGNWAFRFDPETRSWRRTGGGLPEPRLEQISVPTLIVRGAQSALVSRRHARWMRRKIPGAELVEVPRAFHHVPLDNPQATARAIIEFAERLKPK